jgi:DNA phosphorothioation-associated putative methyltransferase
MERIERHKTAIRRAALSRPVQALLDSGVLNRDRTFFDYGCGYGDDIAILAENGFTAAGFDPVYLPKQELIPSDIVNVGYVLNVIEDEVERTRVLKEAATLAQHALSVAVLHESSSNRPSGDDYRDGVLTKRRTFQRLFSNQELVDFVRETTGLAVATVGPGLVFAFKRTGDRAEYMVNRIRGIAHRLRRDPKSASSRDKRISALKSDAPEKWEDYLQFVTQRGRPPKPHQSSLLSVAAARGLSSQALFDAAAVEFGAEQLECLRSWNRNNLLVFLAGTIVDGGTRMSELSPSLKADVKYHYGSFVRAETAAMELLKEAGSLDMRREAAESESAGRLTDDGFYVRSSNVAELSPVLRAYIQLGTLFFGDYNDAELVKAHLRSNKLTFYVRPPDSDGTTYDAFKVDFDKRSMVFFRISSNKVSHREVPYDD